MTPIEALAALDQSLGIVGQAAKIRRYAGADQRSFFEADVLILVNGYTPQPIEPGAIVQQGDQTIVLSPTGLRARQWPEPPKKGDRLFFDGRERSVQAVAGNTVGGETVRYTLQVRG